MAISPETQTTVSDGKESAMLTRMLLPLAVLCLGVFPGCASLNAGGDAARDAFSVAVDDGKGGFKKPLWVRKPPKDEKGRTPQDTVLLFLRHIGKGNDNGASHLCDPFDLREYLGPLADGDFSESAIKTGLFGKFCGTVRGNVTGVLVSRVAIKQKSGYWSVEIKFKTGDSEGSQDLYLKRQNGAWQIHEKPHWKDVAEGTEKEVFF
ncbi:MAG: hypothetical protein HN849_12735 [Victivallales bacterium]|jgi:hypothetical protein|nr:hypothetical protein [Victivallales bacterium]